MLFTYFLTLKFFVEVGPFLLKQPGVKNLYSERFTQDTLEAFYGWQRAKGGHNDNPTVQQFSDSTVSLRVQGSAALDPIRGNCRKRNSKNKTHDIIIDEMPLPKRRRK